MQGTQHVTQVQCYRFPEEEKLKAQVSKRSIILNSGSSIDALARKSAITYAINLACRTLGGRTVQKDVFNDVIDMIYKKSMVVLFSGGGFDSPLKDSLVNAAEILQVQPEKLEIICPAELMDYAVAEQDKIPAKDKEGRCWMIMEDLSCKNAKSQVNDGA